MDKKALGAGSAEGNYEKKDGGVVIRGMNLRYCIGLLFVLTMVVSCTGNLPTRSTVIPQTDSDNDNKKDNQVKGHYALGVSKMKENDYQGAFVEFKKALEIDPKDKESLNALGLVYHRFGEYKNAKESFIKAIASDKNYSDAYNNLGITCAMMGQWAESVEAFRNALKNPLYATPDKSYQNLGFSLYRIGKYDEAIKSFRDSLARNQNNIGSYYGIALCHNAAGRYGEANEALMEGIRLAPEYKGNVQKAQKDFGQKRRSSTGLTEQDYANYLEILNY
ncbi:MAG: tetratricopeptide repeat protein [Nitrospirae bacterium]|nr:tetratricopeptide repeat protein [Nitrospirota bacterium]